MGITQEFRHILKIIPYPLIETLSEFYKCPTVYIFKNILRISLYYFVRIVFGRRYAESLGVNYIGYRTQDVELYIPIDSLFETRVIYGRNIFDRYYKPKTNDIIIDVGAHVGIFTAKMSPKVRFGYVIAVEPDKANYELLIRNIENNKLKNVIPVNAALSDVNGKINLFLGDSSVGHSIVNESRRVVEVRSFTLDELVKQLSLHKVDFIKINAEGAELDILKGAEKTLQENNVSLSIAANHYFAEERDVSSVLSELGFETQIHNRFVYAFRDMNVGE